MNNLYSTLDEYDKEEDKIGMKIQQPRNNAPSNMQITAEQIIKESQAHITDEIVIPIQHINDEDELNEYKLKKRKEFEDQIKRQRYQIGCWLKYALWEERQTEFVRARSIYERAIEIDYRNTSIWLKYAEMEMKNGFVNYARNVWERACKLLPRVDQLWYKWAYMEEMLGNYVGARDIFKAWMTWKPTDLAWLSFAKFEARMGEIDKARQVLYQYLNEENKLQSYIRVAKFEEKHHNNDSARKVYESALSNLGNEALDENFFLHFIRFEIKNKETDRCRTLFKYGLEHITKEKTQKLYLFYVKFEKMYGNKDTCEELVLSKRRLYYEKEIEKNQMNYDIWFDYTKLEEDYGDSAHCREVYERAISNIPPIEEKKYWRRYIFFWINYATYEECNCSNKERAGALYQKLIQTIPHSKFTFSKIWILYAHYYIRCKDLDNARKVLGLSIAFCPREKIIEAYVDLELQLGNIDRVRKIYQSYLEKVPDSSSVWIKYALFENNLDENERCEALFESAISLPLDIPENVWKAYIDLEISFENLDKVRNLYERLLLKTKHIKVWLSYSKFELDKGDIELMRGVYKRAEGYFKENQMKEERAMILDSWYKSEKDPDEKDKIALMLPKKIKILRKNEDAKETTAQIEEYYDYQFPNDEKETKVLKILENAMKWNEANKTNGNE